MRSPEDMKKILMNVKTLKQFGVTKAAWRYDGSYGVLRDYLEEKHGLEFSNDDIYNAFLHWEDLHEEEV